MQNPLVGTWILVQMQHRTLEGEVSYPMGEAATGQLIYSPEGYMAAAIQRAHRKAFRTRGLFEGTDTEKKEAMESFLSYCGPYRIEGNKVIHSVAISLFPNWVGNEEVRFFQFQGGQLILTTPPFLLRGQKQFGHITWQRAGRAHG